MTPYLILDAFRFFATARLLSPFLVGHRLYHPAISNRWWALEN
jgi:hypothetical protein